MWVSAGDNIDRWGDGGRRGTVRASKSLTKATDGDRVTKTEVERDGDWVREKSQSVCICVSEYTWAHVHTQVLTRAPQGCNLSPLSPPFCPSVP